MAVFSKGTIFDNVKLKKEIIINHKNYIKMTIVTSPAKNIYNSLTELEKLLHNAAIRKSKPKVNIVQNENWTELRIAAPGIDKKNIEISLDNGVLKIESVAKEEKELKNDGTYLIKEFDFGNFSLEYKLTEKVNIDKIDAKYKDGILMVKLPFKSEEEMHKTKKIELK